MTLNHKLLDSMILPEGTSLEDFDILEGVGGVPILIPVRRADNPIDKIQKEQGREWITNCPPATAQEMTREKSKKRIYKRHNDTRRVHDGRTRTTKRKHERDILNEKMKVRKEKTYTFLNQREIHSS